MLWVRIPPDLPEIMKGKLGKLKTFLKEVWTEVHPTKGNVEWPGKDEIIGSTIAVLVAVGISALYVGLVDTFFSQIINFLVKSIK